MYIGGMIAALIVLGFNIGLFVYLVKKFNKRDMEKEEM